MKAPTISRRIWLIVSTVAVIGGFFAYYFFVYTEGRRVELEAKKFRAMAQYAENIKGAYAERTKKIFQKLESSECKSIRKVKPDGCDRQKELKKARLDVIKPIINQADFNELVFEEDGDVIKQTFNNAIDKTIIKRIIETNNAETKRQVELTVNDKDYFIFIHSFELGDKSWRIFGFCERNEFQSQVRSVGLKYIVVVSLSLIIILLIMPLLKLLIMNDSEKLHLMNVWFCGFSLVVGSSFLLLIGLMSSDFSANNSSREVVENSDGLTIEARIKKLSIRVTEEFTNELRMIYNQIQESKLGRYTKGDTCPANENLFLYSPQVLKVNEIQFNKYPFFNEILWIKEDGWQETLMATHSITCDDHVNLKTRKYFSQAFYNDSSWSMPDSDMGTERFALQSIHSYLTDRHEAGIGTLLDENDASCGVLAIATKLHSVMDPLLPPGYQFVIIDKIGKVWFHSQTEKNLNENFIDETGQDRRLIAAINGRTEVMITLDYDRSNHRAFARPIRNTGLMLVVLHNDDYFNTTIVLTVGLAFLLLTMLIFFQGLHQLILLTSVYHFSLLKVRRFFLDWLRPEKEKRRIYIRAVFLQVYLIIPLVFVVSFNHSMDLATFFLVLPIYLTVYHYFALEYRRLAVENENQKVSTWLHPFFIASVMFILLVNFAGIILFEVENLALLFIPQLIVIVTLLFFYSWIVIQKHNSRILWMMASATNSFIAFNTRILLKLRLPAFSSFERSYCLFLFLWLILASFMPTYYFYKLSYYEEGKIWMRYLLLTAAREEESRDVELNNELKEAFKEQVPRISDMGKFLTVTDEICTTQCDLGQLEAIKRKPLHEFLFKDIPPLAGIAEETRAAIFPGAGDAQWLSFGNDRSSGVKYFTSQQTGRIYRSELPEYRTLKGDYWPFILIISVLGLLLLYRTLRFCVTHIYGIGLLKAERYITPKLFQGARYFIVGLPHSGKSRFVRMIRRKEKLKSCNVIEINLNDESLLEIGPYCKLVVAKGFHTDLNSHKRNQHKWKRLDELFKYKELSVIVISNIDPSAILEHYDKLAECYRQKEGDAELAGKFRECKTAYHSWSDVLTSYSIHYHQLKERGRFEDKDVNSELDHGEFLPRLYHQLKKPILTAQEREKMVLQVEDLAQAYYRAIWHYLSKSEKFLLHDLAKDRFVNMRNMKTIRALRQKGLMVGRNSLQIMNKSFNNFILSVVQDDADLKMEQQIREKGSWNTVHLILVITIVSIIVFLGLAQQQLFKNFEAILAATTALLPLLARLGGIFGGSKAKE